MLYQQCGLVKNFALMAHITSEVPEGPIIEFLLSLEPVCPIGLVDLEILNQYGHFKIFVNGERLLIKVALEGV